jgi:hypothetical protein
MYAKFTQLKAEVILTIQVLRRYWFSNLVGFFVDLVYFYAIFVAVRSLVPGENLPGTPSLILMYTVLHLTLGFYTSFYRGQVAIFVGFSSTAQSGPMSR